jgi:hypothetical protein
MKYISLLMTLTFTFVACDIQPPKAYAPSRPPVTAKANFSLGQVTGHHAVNRPSLFLWPIDRWDENTGVWVPLSFEEKASSRTEIVRYNAEKSFHQARFNEIFPTLDPKYEKLGADLLKEFKEAECYKLCHPDEFLECDPPDPSLTELTQYKEPENEQEESAILACQTNQDRRDQLQAEKAAEIDALAAPLAEANTHLATAIGNRNIANNLTEFHFCVGMKGGCYPEAGAEVKDSDDFEILISFGKMSFSNKRMGEWPHPLDSDGEAEEVQSAPRLQISPMYNVTLDEELGTVSFVIPDVIFSDDSIQGELHIVLELTALPSGVKADGDVQQVKEDGSERIGRFSSTLEKKR